MTDSTTRFGDRAEDYDRYRPSYPPSLVAELLQGFGRPIVADIGAGTGISAALLRACGAHVYAIEPNAAMRAAIPTGEGIASRAGSAESTTLPDASVDVVTAFQAYHWFDPDATFREVNRIARCRARFAAVWNHRTHDDPFTRAYEAIIACYDTTAGGVDRDRRAGTVLHDARRYGWASLPVLRVVHRHELTLDRLLGFARSCSYLPKTGPAFDSLRAELTALYDQHQSNKPAFHFQAEAHIADRQ